MHRLPRTRHALLVAATLSLLAAACTDEGDDTDGAASAEATGVGIEAVSTRADLVTGGDVLIEVSAAPVDSVSVGGKDVEVDWAQSDGVSRGLVTGLPEGESTIEVDTPDGSAALEVVNHPISGPVFSGERIPMTACTTDKFGLAAATPPECDAGTEVTLAYVEPAGEVVEVDDAADVPAGAAVTAEVDGQDQPVVLRIERGVINRAVYEIVSLDSTGGNLEEFDADHWNGRLVYRFGGGCGTTFAQGFTMLGAPDPQLLADGYAFATSSLNTFQVQCNDVLSAETAMMVKEHFAETVGVPEVTIGEGGSGGAIQQLLIGQNYPGILDAIGPTLVFPDAASIAPGVVDCALLGNYYGSESGASLTTEQRTAVNGHLSGQTCLFWEQTFVPVIDPTKCGFGDAVQGNLLGSIPGLSEGLAVVPDDQLYDPVTNPDGVRCTFQDSYVNVFGRDPDTGFANRPLDNTGVQYGLTALNEGVITPDQFIALNAGVGGFDIDGQPVPERMVADEDVLAVAYESGRVVEGGGLHDIPIIALNVYSDPDGDIHDRFRMFSLEERLAAPDGEQAPNFVMWTRPSSPEGNLVDQLSGALDVGAQITRTLDEWATGVLEDTSDATMVEKLVAARPAEAVNTCFDVDGAVVASGPDVYDGPGPCTDPYPMGGDPRTAAGAPVRNDIAKCQLQPVGDAMAAGVYEADLTDEQVAALEATFPDGVCDWSQPGVGQVPLGEPWRSY